MNSEVGPVFALRATPRQDAEFVNENRVIIAIFDMRLGDKYEVIKDDIFVEGPNGTIVFARQGNKIAGMG